MSANREPTPPSPPYAHTELEEQPATRAQVRPQIRLRTRPLARSGARTAVALSGWVALAATALPGGSPPRWIAVLLFVCFGPGIALLYPQTGTLRPAARIEALALAAPLGLSLAVLTTTSLFLAEAFSKTAFMVSLAVFTSVAAAFPGLPLPAATRGAVERSRAKPEKRR